MNELNKAGWLCAFLSFPAHCTHSHTEARTHTHTQRERGQSERERAPLSSLIHPPNHVCMHTATYSQSDPECQLSANKLMLVGTLGLNHQNLCPVSFCLPITVSFTQTHTHTHTHKVQSD